jgi:type IV pilus assembly protein PilO
MAIETGLEGKPWYVSASVAVVLLAIIVFGADYLKFKGMRRDIASKESRLVDLDRQINEGRAAQQRLPQFREEVRGLELELDRLLRILPSRRNTEDILRRLRTLTEQGDFSLLSFTPRSLSPRDFYLEWPIQIRLNGSYHNLALFFDRIRRFARIINIEDLRLGALGGGHHSISATFTMKTFLYNEPEDMDSEAAP